MDVKRPVAENGFESHARTRTSPGYDAIIMLFLIDVTLRISVNVSSSVPEHLATLNEEGVELLLDFFLFLFLHSISFTFA